MDRAKTDKEKLMKIQAHIRKQEKAQISNLSHVLND